MSNFVLDFLENALPTVGTVAGGIAGGAVDAASLGLAAPLINPITGAAAGSAVGKGAENLAQGKPLGQGVVGAAVGGAVGQGVGGVVAKGAEALAPEVTSAAGKIASGAAKGAAVGGTSSAAAAVAQGQPITGKNLGMDFLQGAATGGVVGGAVPAIGAAAANAKPLNESGYVKLPIGASDDLVNKVFNNQSESGVLYHGTTVDNAASILKDGEIKASVPNQNESFSPQLQNIVGSSVSSDKTPWVSFSRPRNAGFLNSHQADVKFVVDENQLQNNIGKTQPFADKGLTRVDQTGEAEQRIGSNVPLSAIKRIELGPYVNAEDETNIRKLAQENNISVVGHQNINEERQVLMQAGALTSKVSDQFAPEDLQKMAESDNLTAIQKQLEPVTGEVVAQEIAPAIAKTDHPETAANIIDQSVNNKLPNPSPAPTPLPPVTPTSDINTPQQVAGQATAEEQSLFASQPEPSFMNAPGEEPTNTSTHVGNLAGVQDMHDILNNGGSPTDAISHYMMKTNSTPEEAQVALDTLMKQSGTDGSLNKGMVGANSNPEFANASKVLPEVQPGDKTQAVINPKVIHNELSRNTMDALDKGNQLNKNDLALMDTAHGKTLEELLPQAEDKQAFSDAYNALKKNADVEHAIQSNPDALNMDVPYRQNHMGQLRWANSDQEVAQAQAKRVQLSNSPGWSKERTIQNYQEGIQLGLTPKNGADGAPGVIYQDLAENLQQKQSALGQQALYKGLNEAHPGQVSVGDRTDENGVWKQLQVPYGQKLYMPADLAAEINKRAPVPDATGGWATYDKFNGNWKNLKLGGGGFHSLNTMGNWFGQQIASGRIFTHPQDSATMLRSLFDKNFNDNLIKQWNDSGESLLEDRAGLNAKIHGDTVNNPGDTGTEGDIKAEGKLANIPILKQMHEAVFGRQIPMMMKLEFHQDIQGLDPANPDDQAEMVKIAKSINQRYGAQNRDIQGVTARTAKLGGRGVLAWNWNEGQVTALKDALTKGGVEGKLARQTVFGKALLFGALATAGGAAGGEFKGKKPEEIALDILGKTVNPKFNAGSYTVGLPTTQLSLPGKPISEEVGNATQGKGLATPFKDVASARLAAIPSGVEQVLGNRTFAGTPIAGQDYYGRPISPTQTGEALAGMVSPIPVTQGLQTASGKQNIGAALANIAGVNARPTYDLQYSPLAGQTYVQQLEATPGISPQKIQSTSEFFDLIGKAESGKAKTKAVTQAAAAIKAGDTQKADQVIQGYNQKLAKALLPWEQEGGTKYLDTTMLQLLRQATITYGSANKQANYLAKTNPTSIGLPIQALQNQPHPVQ